MANADDSAVSIRLDHLPGFRVVFGIDARHFDELGFHGRHMVGKPNLNLAQEQTRIVEPRVYEKDRLAVQAFETRGHRFWRDRRRKADGI